jgi:hypothetical protein
LSFKSTNATATIADRHAAHRLLERPPHGFGEKRVAWLTLLTFTTLSA